jgi:non-ribosomal peptide synthetase component F
MAQDSLSRSSDGTTDSAGPSVSVFVDLDAANGSAGQLGVEVEYGPRVGPATLDELLCTGSVQVIGLADGRPVVTSDAAKAIPPAVRRTVAWRDQGCTIDGCHSRYRLQPHHIRQRHHGGNHDPDNLATLCSYHHHVAVHGQGFCIDPDSPPQRRRLIRTRAGPDPP